MLVNWEETSWREKGIWLKAAGDENCPILEEYGQESPQSMKKRRWIVKHFCQNGCNLFVALDQCPHGQQMAEELHEIEEEVMSL